MDSPPLPPVRRLARPSRLEPELTGWAMADSVAADDSWFGSPAAALPLPAPTVRIPPPARGRGRVLAVWGPTGAPGRTAVAIGLADEAARLGVSTLLVDADTYGGTVAQTLALPVDSSGLALACRSAAEGRLDTAGLAVQSRQLRPSLRVLTGVGRADRWPELRPSALVGVLEQARHLSALTVVDCGFCLEQDEELSYDTATPRRNGAALAVLGAADTVICVGAADPVGLRRLIGALDELREVAPEVAPLVVVNRVRATVIPGEPEREIAAALTRWAGISASAYLPAAPAVLDLAMRTGATLAEAAPASPLRRAVAELARELRRSGSPTSPPLVLQPALSGDQRGRPESATRPAAVRMTAPRSGVHGPRPALDRVTGARLRAGAGPGSGLPVDVRGWVLSCEDCWWTTAAC